MPDGFAELVQHSTLDSEETVADLKTWKNSGLMENYREAWAVHRVLQVYRWNSMPFSTKETRYKVLVFSISSIE